MAAYTSITHLEPRTWRGSRSGMIFRWTDSYSDVLYQLYINGELAAETKSTNSPKELIAAPQGNFHWQILAIDPEDAGTDYSSSLDLTDDEGSRVRIRWPRRSSELEIGSKVNIYWDAGDGSIDLTSAINNTLIDNFPAGAPRWGFGFGSFGEQAFGYDGEGMGFGNGAFGVGEFGFDCDYVEFITQPLPPGTYKFKISQLDAAGNNDGGGIVEESVVVDCPPAAPEIEIASYDSGTDVLTLTVTEGTMPTPYS